MNNSQNSKWIDFLLSNAPKAVSYVQDLLTQKSTNVKLTITIEGRYIAKNIGEPFLDGEGLISEWEAIVELKQHGKSITGIFIEKCVNKPLEDTDYKLTGRFFVDVREDGSVVKVLEVWLHQPEYRGNHSTFLLTFNDENKLQGIRTFLGRKKNVPRSVNVEWVRVNKAQKPPCESE